MVNRADGLDPYATGLPREWVERLANSDETTDSLLTQTRINHKPTITPAISVSAPGLGPQPLAIGNVMTLHYDTPATDAGYRILKIPSSLVVAGNARAIEPYVSFHIHWTKANDVDQSGATIRWVFEYTMFDGHDDEILTPTVSGTVNMDDTYIDAGTTTRIVYRTANFEITDLVPGYYLGVKVTTDNANTTASLQGNGAIVSADMLWKGWLNTEGEGFV
jgi:hypothetical protein